MIQMATSWPVILQQSLEKTDLCRLLRQKNFKLRYNISGSVIFPLSGIAFLILHLRSITDSSGEIKTEIWESIDKFIQVHRRCYILAQEQRHTEKEQKLYHEIQKRYFKTKLQMMPVHNSNESVQSMLTIAKLLCKPTNSVMTKRFEGVMSQVISEDYTENALSQLGISSHEIQYIQDGIGNLSQLASATEEDLINCSLDMATVNRILSVFQK